MRNALYIRTRLDDILVNMTYQSEQQTRRQKAMAETYFWIYNDGNLRKESEVENRLQNCYDELKCFEMLGEKSPMKLRPIYEKINILKDFLRDD